VRVRGKTQAVEGPAFIPEGEGSDEESEAYFDAVYGDKVGGTPAFFQGDAWPDRSGSQNWRLLLQLKVADREEFVLNIPSTLFAFINKNATRGAMLSQH
jgi:uncharacterized protein YwqG